MVWKTGRFFSPFACSLVLSLLGAGSALAQAGWATQAQDLLAQADAQVGNGQSDPSLAVGLSGFSYYKSPLFLNLMKQAAAASIWIGDQEQLDASALAEQKLVDSLGYPTRMVEGNAGLPGWKQGYEYFVSIHHPLPEIQAETAGDVIIEWTGQGQLAVVQLVNITETARQDAQGRVIGGRISGTWPKDSKLRALRILETDPDNPIRDISIVKAEYQDLYEAGAIFDPRFLRLIQDHHTLRFMDWMRTNGSDVMTPKDVLRPEAATWAVGVDVTNSPDIAAKRLLKMPGQVPFAVMVQLANEVGADPWFNIPLKADDAYVTALAAYVAEHLDPGLIPIFELSNEIWNFGRPFEQTREASLLGSQARADRDIKAARYYYGYRSAALRTLLNAAVPERAFQLVMGTQTVNYKVATLTEAGVEAYFKDQGRKGQMSDVFDALAVTGYFNAIGPGDMEALRTYWYAQSESRFARGEAETKHRYFVERAADYLANGVEALDPGELSLIKPRKRNRIHHSLEDPIEGFLRETFAENKKMAEGWDLELIQYEADSHIAPRNYRDDPESEWFKALNNSPEMGKLITRMTEIFREEGGTLVNDFGHLGQSGFGLWGTRAYLADENPISAAYDAYNQTAAQSFGSLNVDRMPGVFLQGVTETGSDQGDVLIGTVKRDYLLGKGGADLLVGGPAPDGLHGGDGVDMVLLPGAEADYTFEADALGRLVIAQDGVADRLVDIELIGFAGSGEIRRVADWTGEVSVPALQDLIDTFAKGNPKGETLGL